MSGGRPKAMIVGAGLAGLAASVRLSSLGFAVRLFEATDHAGGRCRSFHDKTLDQVIDNGNHLVLTGNRSVQAYLREIGAENALTAAPDAAIDFVELPQGLRWRVAMNAGPLPWWVMIPSRRPPEAALSEFMAGLGLAVAGRDATVAEAIRTRGPLWRRFWEPLCVAVLNAPPERASARLLWAVMRETFARGAARSRPMFARDGLGAALVTPALTRLAQDGAHIRFGAPLKRVETEGDRVARLVFDEETLAPAPREPVVLALPPSRLKAVAPWIDAPEDRTAIVNAHFKLDDPSLLAAAPPILGVIGAKTQWIFSRDGVASVTISAAEAYGLAEAPTDELLPTLWREVRAALSLPSELEPAAGRILREKRATFDQSPAGVARRPRQRAALANLILAGDASDTGLPATIEGAIRSGHRAATLARRIAQQTPKTADHSAQSTTMAAAER